MQRVKRVVLLTTLFLICGCSYAIIISCIGFGIPCVFHLITGIRCPGCGMTHAMLALIKFNFYEALSANYALPLIGLYVLLVYLNTSIKYIKSGKYHLTSGSSFIDISFLALIILWGIARNIIGI